MTKQADDMRRRQMQEDSRFQAYASDMVNTMDQQGRPASKVNGLRFQADGIKFYILWFFVLSLMESVKIILGLIQYSLLFL